MDVQIAALTGEVSAFFAQLSIWAADALPRLVGAALLLIGGWWLAVRVDRTIRRFIDGQRRIDPTFVGVAASVARYGILTIVLVAVLGQLGIQTTSILAALGAIGLAIGLALQGTLSNIAAGVMLLWLRPFRVGDDIDAGSVAGNVREVGLFATHLRTGDGVFLFVPNSELWNKRILNFTRLPTRMLDLQFRIAYGDDIGKGRRALLDLAAPDIRVHKEPAPQVFVAALGDDAVVLTLRMWMASVDYWPVSRDLTEGGKHALEAAGLSMPFPQRDVHLTRTETVAAPPTPKAA